MFSFHRMIGRCFLSPVNQPVRSLSRNSHNIFFIYASEQERAVCLTFLQNSNICYLIRLYSQCPADHLNGFCLKLAGIAINFPKLFIGINFYHIHWMDNTGCDKQPAIMTECRFPKWIIISSIFRKFFDSGSHDLRILLSQVANADHGIASFSFRHCHQLHPAVYANTAFLVNKITDHIPGIQFVPMEWIILAPDITWNYVRVWKVLQDKPHWVEIILDRIFRIDYQVNAVFVNQILVFLFHEADNNINFPDSDFMKLPDNPFNQ